MTKVTVITGGAGGMGLATAKIIGRDHHVIIADVNQQRLDAAIVELQQAGVSCDSSICDITEQSSVDALVAFSTAKGTLVSVVHTAGLSPQMANAETILRVNALGTVNIAESFLKVAGEGFALVNVASMAGHLMPNVILPTRCYRYALTDPARMLRKMRSRCHLIPKDFIRSAMAYSISKNFVIWYGRHNAARFGAKGARVLSVSPGVIDTSMGRLEEKSGSADIIQKAALKRYGRPEELAEVLAFCAGEKASFLTGTDVLCDGGAVAGMRWAPSA